MSSTAESPTSQFPAASPSENAPSGWKPRKLGGAPRGNENALRHGLRCGKLPAGCKHIEMTVQRFRKKLEEATLETHGEVRLEHAAILNTACRAETVALLATRWLRMAFDELSPDSRLAHAEMVVKASERRDRAIRNLRLGSATPSFDLYSRPAAASTGGDGSGGDFLLSDAGPGRASNDVTSDDESDAADMEPVGSPGFADSGDCEHSTDTQPDHENRPDSEPESEPADCENGRAER